MAGFVVNDQLQRFDAIVSNLLSWGEPNYPKIGLINPSLMMLYGSSVRVDTLVLEQLNMFPHGKSKVIAWAD